MTELADNHRVGSPAGLFAHGRADPIECGRKGGSAPRRSSTARTALSRVLASKAGAPNYQIYRLELEKEQARQREVYARDREILAMDEMLAAVREQVEEQLAVRERVDAELAEREAQLEQARSDPAALKECLQAAGERAVELAVIELGWWVDDVA
jgi:hypothetical protein